MSYKVKALVPRPSDQRSGENQLLQVVLRSQHMLYGIFAYTPQQKKNVEK